MGESESLESSDDFEETPSDTSGLDESELRDIEDDLFDLEDELIKMQGTNVRTVEEEDETEESREIEQIYAYQKPEDKTGSETSKPDTENVESGNELMESLEAFRSNLESMNDVKGGQLLAADLRDEKPKFDSGIYTVTSPRGDRIFATRRGQVVWQDNKIHALPLRRIDSDVDNDVGDIRYDGSVLVDGNVSDGRVIEATGNIWVMGSVGRSSLNAYGDVVVKKGIKGVTDRKIKARGNIFAKFVENAYLEANQNIIAEEAIMHSKITAGENIFLLGDPGFLAGGSAQAGETIFVNELGSKNSPETLIRMGSDSSLQEELDKLRARRKELREEEESKSRNVDNFLEKKKNNELSPKDEDRLQTLQFELNQIRQDLQEKKNRIKDIQENLKGEVNQRILIRSTLYSGISVQISDAHKDITQQKSHTSIEFNNGELIFGAFEEPEFDFDFETTIDPEEIEFEETHDTTSLENLRRHVVFTEDKPVFDREAQLKRLLGLSEEKKIAVLDITNQERSKGLLSSRNEAIEAMEESEYDVKVWWGIEIKPGETKRDVELQFGNQREDSVKVKCKDPKEGFQKAMDYFKADPDELAVQILEEGRSGIWGIGQKDYLIRVKKKNAIQREDQEPSFVSKDLMSDLENEDVAGFINLVNSDDGLMLSVYPPEGHGLPVTVEQVEEKLEEQGFDHDIDFEAVEKAVEEAEGEEVRIGPRQRNPEVDGSFSVEVNEDNTEAYLTLTAPKPEGLPVDKQEVLQYLEEDGMNYDRGKIDEVFEENIYDERIEIATGIEPKDGEDGHIEFKTDIEIDEFMDDGESDDEEEEPSDQGKEESVDHRQGNQIVNVKEGEILAEIIPAKQGEPGKTIYGEEIPCEPGEEIDLSTGDNVARSGDGRQLIAESDGRLVYKSGKLKVEPVFVVNGDLDYEVGNITFDGVVIIKGAILDGFVVEAGERVEAKSAGKATIRSKGDVFLKNGMAGKDEGSIEAEGNVFAKYLENVSVESGGSVIVDQTIMHSDVDADEYVLVQEGRKGNIIGGKTRAGKGVGVKKLGSGMSNQTEVEVGIKPHIRDRIRTLEEEIETQKAKFKKVRLGLKGLNQQIDEHGGKENLPEEKQEKHERLSNVAQAIKHKIDGLHGELEELRNQIQTSEGGEVCVEETVFEGGKITIQTSTIHLTEPYDQVRFILENGEVVRRSFMEIDVSIEEADYSI